MLLPMSDSQFHYLDEHREQQGPVSEEGLKQLASEGRISAETLVWTPAWTDWRPASSVAGLFEQPATEAIARAAVQQPVQASVWGGPARPSPNYSPKSFKTLFTWWVITFAIAMGASMIMGAMVGVAAAMESNGNYRGAEQLYIASLIFVIPVVLVGIVGYVLWAVMVYRWWRQIQDGHASTTPGKATGFQFIPLFNLYWWFVMIWKLPQDLAAYGVRHGLTVRPASSTLAMATCVLFVSSSTIGSCLGVLGLPLTLAFFVLLIISALQFTRASMDIAANRTDGPAICVNCNYNLAGVTSGRCPECGRPFGDAAPTFG